MSDDGSLSGLEPWVRVRLVEDRTELDRVAALHAQGLTSPQIATELHIHRSRAKQLVGQTKRGIISVSAKAYARISAEADRCGVPICTIVEWAVHGVPEVRQ